MKKLIVIAVALLFIGCKGKDGSPGIPGSTMFFFEGTLISDPQDIYIQMLDTHMQTNLSVYVSKSSNEYTELPVYLADLDKNIGFAAKYGNITISGSAGTGFDHYKIVVTKKG